MKRLSRLQQHRSPASWQCEICMKKITGKRNTYHLGVMAHVKSEIRKGLRKKEG